MLHITNVDFCCAAFVVGETGPRRYLTANKTRTLDEWRPGIRLRIGWINGRNELWAVVDNAQTLPGRFTITQYRGVMRVAFEAESDAKDDEKYTDEQYRRVADVFTCECARKGCSCVSTPDARRANCEHLVQKGLVTAKQLDAILAELF